MKFLILSLSLFTADGLKYLKTPQTPKTDLKVDGADLKVDEAESEAKSNSESQVVVISDGMESEAESLDEAAFESATAQQVMTSLTQQAFDEAIAESGLDPKNLSAFAKYSYRFPKSMVDYIIQMKKTTQRKHQYNFVGRTWGATDKERGARAWALKFAEKNFSDSDIFVVTGMNALHKPIGTFDKTLELGSRGAHEKIKISGRRNLDKTYWDMLVSSNYTLCPGGDDAFSHRAYEAALAGSIPLIKSVKADFTPYGSKSYENLGKVFKLFKYQLKDSPREYDQSIVDHNFDVVIKYMTFIEGDNVPPGAH